jgi:16S rRNA (guanine966-N2)-methyltransferase
MILVGATRGTVLPERKGPRIIAGQHRGRRLVAPPGLATRPTADRVRQALFDMLWHAPWAGRAAIADAHALDAFAGTGVLGLEALSRGAAHATFLEIDRAALASLRANIGACGEEARCTVLAADACNPPTARTPCTLVFLDPPYGAALIARALAALAAAGWLAPRALITMESAAAAPPPDPPGYQTLAERAHGPARLTILRAA